MKIQTPLIAGLLVLLTALNIIAVFGFVSHMGDWCFAFGAHMADLIIRHLPKY